MTWRYRFLLFAFIFLFLVILGRDFYWQVVKAVELSALGESQYGQTIKLNPLRGEIRTSDGFPIASNKLSYIVFANPKEVKDKTQTAELLAPILTEDQASISALLNLNRFWVALSNNVDNTIKTKIDALDLPGVGFNDESVRFYPEASMAAKLLGFVGKDDNGDPKGYFGLEGYYDRLLRGKEGVATEIHDALGHPILAKLTDTSGEVDGRDLTLHIDRVLQYIMEDELKKGMEAYGADSAMAAMMDPKTGGILALASYPSFDPSTYYKFDDEDYKDGFITDTYEPGSTFKPLVMAAAINEGLVKSNTRCDICSGPVSIGGYEIHTWNDEYQPNLTMNDVIVHSDNTG
ncbi:MAG TPA: penicillin-binding transpeptidase domain-containing protein, partial [Patescibacteria group bacterium]|nr:penicillin-binding transpeptidase domain-containing protein [Patescibacteria group bacterium]